MNVLYHLTAPPPALDNTDAVFQEVNALQSRFGGVQVQLYPFQRPGIRLPRAFYGWHRFSELKASENTVDLHHLFANQLYPYPIFHWLKKPVIYSIVASVQAQRLRSWPKWFSFAKFLVVSNVRDLLTLKKWGFKNCVHIRPGIDVDRFNVNVIDKGSAFNIVAGSAPWTHAQFKKKGFDLLLAVASTMPNIHLTLLWRGIFFNEIQERVKYYNLANRVEIINRKIDVNRVLAHAHAAIVLADKPDIVKSYPHSLIEALAAGKPVLISNTIPMADYVKEQKCGQIVYDFTAESVKKSIKKMIDDYADMQAAALQVGQRDFSLQTMLDHYEDIYLRSGYKFSESQENASICN